MPAKVKIPSYRSQRHVDDSAESRNVPAFDSNRRTSFPRLTASRKRNYLPLSNAIESNSEDSWQRDGVTLSPGSSDTAESERAVMPSDVESPMKAMLVISAAILVGVAAYILTIIY